MTKNEIIAEYKKEYATLHKTIDGQDIVLTEEEYETTIEQWAENELAKEAELAEAEAKAAQKAALLDRLGITEDEAKLLLA
jgi:hypothetical protein